MAQGYRYGLVNRPPWCMLVPDHPFQWEQPLGEEDGRTYTRHGVIIFDRPLTVEEICRFDLALLADADLTKALAIEVALAIVEVGMDHELFAQEDASSLFILVADTLRQIRPYRVYVGDMARFAQMVEDWHAAITLHTLPEDADLQSVLYSRQLASRGGEPRTSLPKY